MSSSDDAMEAALRESLAEYAESLPPWSTELRAAWAAGDVATVRRVAHKVRGTAAFFGDAPLVAAAAAVEDTEPDDPAFAARVAALEAELAAQRPLLTAGG